MAGADACTVFAVGKKATKAGSLCQKASCPAQRRFCERFGRCFIVLALVFEAFSTASILFNLSFLGFFGGAKQSPKATAE